MMKPENTRYDATAPDSPVRRREQIAWALYDFANSGYTTVVLTTIFSAYFVGVVASGPGGYPTGTATLLWTLSIGSANFCVLLAAPIVGAIADHRAAKKRFLLITTVGCVMATALLALVGPGDMVLGLVLVFASAIMFSSGENLISAFLPEIVPIQKMGRMVWIWLESGLFWRVADSRSLSGLYLLGSTTGAGRASVRASNLVNHSRRVRVCNHSHIRLAA